MNNKRTTYLMLIIVFGIWGLIGWRIWKGMQNDDENNTQVGIPHAKKMQGSASDSFALFANYRDPFLGKTFVPEDRPISTPSAKIITPQVTPSPTPENPWPELRYQGFVRNTKPDAAARSFLSINGNNHFVKAGNIIDGLLISRIWPDSIEVVRDKEKRIVRK
jgi:hypothetical protein